MIGEGRWIRTTMKLVNRRFTAGYLAIQSYPLGSVQGTRTPQTVGFGVQPAFPERAE